MVADVNYPRRQNVGAPINCKPKNDQHIKFEFCSGLGAVCSNQS